eukprot:gene31150-35161_t
MPKRKSTAASEEISNLKTVLSLIETLTAEELVKVKEKVNSVQMGLPMVLPKLPKELKHLQGKFTIVDKGCKDHAHDFDDIFPDTVHSYKLVWNNGDEMNLKIVNQTGVMYAGTTRFEVQGFQVGPLLMTASFPEEPRLPKSAAEDLDDSIAELITTCKDHGVEFKTYEQLSAFIMWLMDKVMEGPTHYVRYIVDSGTLAEAYDEYYTNPEEEDGHSDQEEEEDI